MTERWEMLRLPRRFVWSRYGTEAGETIGDIISRKERERQACSGTFLWGIGSSIKPGLGALLRREDSPLVLFSPMLSPPQPADVSPQEVVRWSAGVTLQGQRYEVPAPCRVTSGRSKAGRIHYALVCRSDEPLVLRERWLVDFATLRNLCSGRPLGASQVTAVVTRVLEGVGRSRLYPVALVARLAAPYFVQLTRSEPVLAAPVSSCFLESSE